MFFSCSLQFDEHQIRPTQWTTHWCKTARTVGRLLPQSTATHGSHLQLHPQLPHPLAHRPLLDLLLILPVLMLVLMPVSYWLLAVPHPHCPPRLLHLLSKWISFFSLASPAA
jgi:hypothetical protein